MLSLAIQITDVFGSDTEQKIEKKLSWLDIIGISALANDGSVFLFTHFGPGSGTNYAVYLRRTDGSPAVRIGEGRALALSPDKTSVLVKLNVPEQLNILPATGGESRKLPSGEIQHFDRAAYFPDGQNILFTGNFPGKNKQCFIQNISSGEINPLTPEGITGTLISPDGDKVVVSDIEGNKMLYQVATRKLESLKGLAINEQVINWSLDNDSIFTYFSLEIPVKIYKLNLITGRKQQLLEVQPADPAGILGNSYFFITPDGKYYLYSLRRYTFDLYSVENLSVDSGKLPIR